MRARLINKLTGTVMTVPADRLMEYLAMGHKPADDGLAPKSEAAADDPALENEFADDELTLDDESAGDEFAAEEEPPAPKAKAKKRSKK